MYSFKCRDVGQKCDFEVSGVKSEEELLTILKIHAEKDHGIKEITPQMMQMIKMLLR
jgi:predicted small metal-binding protein